MGLCIVFIHTSLNMDKSIMQLCFMNVTLFVRVSVFVSCGVVVVFSVVSFVCPA